MDTALSSALISTVVATLVGGGVGFLASYYGPIGVEKWKQGQAEKKYDGPRRGLLKKLLGDKNYTARKLDTLCMYIGATPEECRRLLIGLDARGCVLDGDQEGWALISKMPFDEE